MISRFTRFCKSFSKLSDFSSSSAYSLREYARIASSVVFGPEIESEEPTERNSKRFPVNANGEVLFLSVESFGIGGRTSTPMDIFWRVFELYGVPSFMDFRIDSSSSPRYMEITAGGASCAPSRWSFDALATEIRRRS